MIATIIKAAAYAPRQDSYEDVHKAYLKAYDNVKYLEIYGEEKEEKMEMAESEKEEHMMMAEPEMMMPDRALIEVDEKAALLGPSKEKTRRTVKSRFPAPTSISAPQADDILGDTEQMK